MKNIYETKVNYTNITHMKNKQKKHKKSNYSTQFLYHYKHVCKHILNLGIFFNGVEHVIKY